MQEAVRTLAAASPFPLAVMPNAGLPKFSDGKYVYDLEPGTIRPTICSVFVNDYGAALVGGCCGTTPLHIRALVATGRRTRARAAKKNLRRGQATSLFSAQEFRVQPGPLIIGEQTNATGQPEIQGGPAGRRPGRHGWPWPRSRPGKGRTCWT